MNEGRPEDARESFEAALRSVPAYAPAQGHLAEVEAQLGETEFRACPPVLAGGVIATTLITLRNSRAFSGTPAVTTSPGTGAGSPRRVTTNCLRVAPKPSPIMQRNSGLLRVPMPARRSDGQE